MPRVWRGGCQADQLLSKYCLGWGPLPASPSMPAMTIPINMTDRGEWSYGGAILGTRQSFRNWRMKTSLRIPQQQQRGSRGWVTITMIPVAPPPCTLLTPCLPGYGINICAQWRFCYEDFGAVTLQKLVKDRRWNKLWIYNCITKGL